MKIYSSINNDLMEVNEISFLVSEIDELLKIKEFIDFCIHEIKNNADYNHEHFSDFLEKKNYKLLQTPEIIICK